jgi:adhesin HecA-like repeat protein
VESGVAGHQSCHWQQLCRCKQPHFVRQATANPLEIGRQSYTVDAAVDKSTYTIGLRKAGVITNALQLDTDQLIVNGSTVISAGGVSLVAVMMGDWRLSAEDDRFTWQLRSKVYSVKMNAFVAFLSVSKSDVLSRIVLLCLHRTLAHPYC